METNSKQKWGESRYRQLGKKATMSGDVSRKYSDTSSNGVQVNFCKVASQHLLRSQRRNHPVNLAVAFQATRLCTSRVRLNYGYSKLRGIPPSIHREACRNVLHFMLQLLHIFAGWYCNLRYAGKGCSN